MTLKLVPVILCGGSGTRLWPVSRALQPKQLMTVADGGSLLQGTWQRLAAGSIAGAVVEQPVVVCNESHRFLVEADLRKVGADPLIVLEPVGRNTAPAAAVAALLAQGRFGPDSILLVLPSDHVFRDAAALREAIGVALPAAAAGQLVTFGIVPDRPETGFGYIQADAGQAVADKGLRTVHKFIEKPDLPTAERYVRDGGYYWNSGMFLFSAPAYLSELAQHAPGMLSACRNALGNAAGRTDRLVRLDTAMFTACPSDSIDYAVMEKTKRAAVVPLDAGWSDVGSWSALQELGPQDSRGNVALGDVTAIDCSDTYIRSESRLVAAVGLRGCVVVETKDAVLVAPREQAQDVKKLVEQLRQRGRSEITAGREVFRPWGSYDSLESGTGFQVKRLTVLPGAVLSLQLHHRRAEHWVVVAGTARITLNDDVFDLQPGQHTFIPIEARHRIENPGTEILHVIEVQIGDYLGEDDIVRFEDKYGRQGRTD